MKRALFLDRDGTLIRQIPYLKSPNQVALEKGVASGLRQIHAAGFVVIVVTNQSGVARGLFTLDDVRQVHARIAALLAEKDEKIDDFYICPHHPDFGTPCTCRKPLPGLLFQAARDWDIDLADSIMCGDKFDDLLTGKNAGCRASVLIRTGYGKAEEEKARAAHFQYICDDFSALTHWVLNMPWK